MTLTERDSSIDVTGRCDDGSDESITSTEVAERAAVQGIGKIRAITPIRLSVAIKNGEEAQTFSCSRTWTSPRTVLHLSPGRLALKNITFFVSDDGLATEDLLIGLPVLRHLKIDTKALLESNRATLDGTDCSTVESGIDLEKGGYVSRIMIARINRVTDNGHEKKKPQHSRTLVDYYKARTEEDPFPDPSLLDQLDEDQHEEIRAGVGGLLENAFQNGSPPKHGERLRGILHSNIDVFRTSFSSGPPAKLRTHKIELTPDAKPTQVRLRNYSKEQLEFLSNFVTDLVRNNIAYANPTSPWACAPHLVPKPGARFRFTVDLRPVNQFTVRHQFPMPNLEQELSKLSQSRFFATFDMSHGYWQLPLHPDSQELQSFVTPDGIFSPTRVLHGTKNAVSHLQSALAEIYPTELRKKLLNWLDDTLLHDHTVTGLLQAVEDFFKDVREAQHQASSAQVHRICEEHTMVRTNNHRGRYPI